MKRYLIVILLALLFLGCEQAPKEKADDRPLILTSIYPYELLIKQLAGDALNVRSLIPPNASVHSYSPQPNDLKDLHRADLIIVNGMGLEALIEQNLKQYKDKTFTVAEELKDLIALDSLMQIRREQLAEEHLEHGHIGSDPHLWTSPKMMLKLATSLKNILTEKFSDAALVINHNYDALKQELLEANELILKERKGFAKPAIVTYHNSFHYFCNDYDIHYLGWVQSSPGKEPSPKELAQLGAKIKAHKVKSIFIEPQQNPKPAEVLAKEYSLSILTLDPIGYSLSPKSFGEFILLNWQTMKQAF